MVLTEREESVVRKMPIIEEKIQKSADGKFIIHKTIITWIKPVGYYEKVLEGPAEAAV
jgi:hypothetical protein